MGARFRVVRPEDLPRRRRRADYALDIVADKRGQLFEMQLSAEREAQLEINVLQCERHDRHLLLLVKTPEAKDRFLCGHDEREWFVAAVPGGASTRRAGETRPAAGRVRDAADTRGLTSASARAGTTGPSSARVNGSSCRRRICAWMRSSSCATSQSAAAAESRTSSPRCFRTGGETLYVCSRFPNGITEAEYQRTHRREPEGEALGLARARPQCGRVCARHRASSRPRDDHAARVAPRLDEHREHDAPQWRTSHSSIEESHHAAGEGHTFPGCHTAE